MHGYSSSEESDDPRRPTSTATPSSSKDEKKKKKKKPTPQQAINHVWKTFQTRKFTKALSVLPFDPVPPSTSSVRANESFAAGYERVVEECRRKVQKIVKDCKRVNMRYRDVGWDLDWDLKMSKGACLNGLGEDEFDLDSGSASSKAPKAVKRVHEIFENPTFMKTVSGADVVQGNIGNCWLMASLSALANVEDGIKRMCVEYNTKIGVYGFVFYRDGEWIYSIIDDKLYLKARSWDSFSLQREILSQIEDGDDAESVYRKTYQTGSKALYFGQCKDQNETWLPLVEKAYVKAHGDYAATVGGWIGEGLEDLTGGVTTELLASDILDTDEFWDQELSRVNDEFMFGCCAGLLDNGYGERDGICEAHAYVVMDAKTLRSGERLVKLRNPWGKARRGLWTGKYSDGSKEWNDPDVQGEVGHKFGTDSVFWISYSDLLKKYLHIDRTRLFRDPGWRMCQRWIGVDVAWKPQYNEKFHIRLTRDSPVVLVLSQLDGRYFKGLSGQYTFRLQFRVHEQGRAGAEEYIVRSHGNYLMDRSVSVELPDMEAGNYTVFIRISATRHLSRFSIEDVIRRECKSRTDNEKLAQVGYAYDLAHSKAWAHMEEVTRLRAIKEHKKASECRKQGRRKMWERRHLNREATKKQTKKNGEKNEKRRTARGEKKKEEDEKRKKEEDEKKKKEEDDKEDDKKKKEEGDKKKGEGDKKKEEDGKKEDEKKTKDQEQKPQAKSAQTDENKMPGDTKEDGADAGAKNDGTEPKPEGDKTAETGVKAENIPATDKQKPQDDKLAGSKSEETKADENKPSGDDNVAKDGSLKEAATGEKPEPKELKSDLDAEGKSKEAAAEKSDKSERNPAEPEDKSGGERSKGEEATNKSADASEVGTSEEKDATKVEEASEKKDEENKSEGNKGDGNEGEAKKVEASVEKKDEEKGADEKAAGAEKKEGAAEATTATVTITTTTTITPPCACGATSNEPPPPLHGPDSDGDSSDSPVSDFEDLYSEDDYVRKPRTTPVVPVSKRDLFDSDDEDTPDPWNALCVVGFRVYSKDENLELRVIMEGGELQEDGMGTKGPNDMDDGTTNAGGERQPEEPEGGAVGLADKGKGKEENGFADYQTVVSKGEGGLSGIPDSAEKVEDPKDGAGSKEAEVPIADDDDTAAAAKETPKKDDDTKEEPARSGDSKSESDPTMPGGAEADDQKGGPKDDGQKTDDKGDGQKADKADDKKDKKADGKKADEEDDKQSVGSSEFDMCSTPQSGGGMSPRPPPLQESSGAPDDDA